MSAEPHPSVSVPVPESVPTSAPTSGGTDAPAPAASAEGIRSRRLRNAAIAAAGWWHYATAATIALLAALWTYRPWALGTAMPFPNGDALQVVAWAKNVGESGWYESGERLAAPFTSNVHPFTVTDELYFGLVKLLLPVLGDAAATVTWLLVLSFPAAALTAVLLARHLGLSKTVSVLVGTAFAVHIDHFLRGFGHFQLAATWVIPIGVLAAVSLVHPTTRSGRRRVAWEVALVVGLLATGFTSAYYAVFAGVLVATAGIAAAWTRRSWWTLGLTGLRGAALALPVVVGVVLDKLYLPAGIGYEAVEITRGMADSEIYGGKITAMLLPSSAHRLGALRELRHSYDSVFPNNAEGPALGLVASLGFVCLVVWAVGRYWRPEGISRIPVLGTLAGLMWVSLFVYVVGGLGTVWALVLDGGGLRVWSRMHIVIMLLSVLAVAVVVDRLRPPWRVVVAGLVTLVALADGTSPMFRPDVDAARAVATEVRALTSQIAEVSGPDASVFQYPAITFPIPNRATAPASIYDGYLPYVYSDSVHWSYGGLQGDPANDWQQELDEYALDEQLVLLGAAGFDGVLVDTAPLTSTPEQASTALDLLGRPDVTSASGRWQYFRLDAPAGCAADVLETAGDLAVRPVLVYPGDGLEMRGTDGGANDEGAGEIHLSTLREAGWDDVTVTFQLLAETSMRVEFPDGSTAEYAAGPHAVRWTGQVQPEDVVRLTRTGQPGAYAVAELDAHIETPAAVGTCLAALDEVD